MTGIVVMLGALLLGAVFGGALTAVALFLLVVKAWGRR